MGIRGYRLGCPVWGHKEWVGELFTRDASAEQFLSQYASVFNCVEGNTTFYGLPRQSSVERWAEDTPENFRFCFKLPRELTHERKLEGAESGIREFLRLFAPLGPRLGPLLIQLPPSFGASDLPSLERCLAALPAEQARAVELRHPTFFSGGSDEQRLNAILEAGEADRVIFDARGLHQAESDSALVRETQRRKPKLPVKLTLTGRRPFVRFVAHPELAANRWLLMGWADQIAAWIDEGLEPYVFVHAPDETHAPALARNLHELIGRRTEIGAMPPWPSEVEPKVPEQLSLLDEDAH